MTLNPILAARLRASGLLTRRPTVAAVVEQLLAVQAQDEPSTAYSFYLRTGLSAAAISAELVAGAIIRLHLPRPTWHYVRRADLPVLLTLLAGPLLAVAGRDRRAMGWQGPTLERALKMLESLLTAQPRPAAALIDALTPAFPAIGQNRRAGRHLLQMAEALGLVGQIGADYHWLNLPPAPERSRAERLQELGARWLAGRAVASGADLGRWLVLPAADRALMLAPFPRRRWAGVDYYHSAGEFDAGATFTGLLPLFDELVLSHRGAAFPGADALPPPPFVNGQGLLLRANRRLGYYRRPLRAGQLQFDYQLPPGQALPVELAAVAADWQRWAAGGGENEARR